MGAVPASAALDGDVSDGAVTSVERWDANRVKTGAGRSPTRSCASPKTPSSVRPSATAAISTSTVARTLTTPTNPGDVPASALEDDAPAPGPRDSWRDVASIIPRRRDNPVLEPPPTRRAQCHRALPPTPTAQPPSSPSQPSSPISHPSASHTPSPAPPAPRARVPAAPRSSKRPSSTSKLPTEPKNPGHVPPAPSRRCRFPRAGTIALRGGLPTPPAKPLLAEIGPKASKIGSVGPKEGAKARFSRSQSPKPASSVLFSSQNARKPLD